MKVVLDGAHPRLFWVTSESESDASYIVDLCMHEVGLDANGTMLFNGRCGGPNGEHGCKDFIYRCEPRLRKPENMGRVFRCKHIRAAREHALDILLPYIKRTDPNTELDEQT